MAPPEFPAHLSPIQAPGGMRMVRVDAGSAEGPRDAGGKAPAAGRTGWTSLQA